MSEVEWTNESVMRLVQAYRQLPELWDRGHELYAVQTAKYEAWTSLAKLFRCDIADLRRKITSILASYRREKGKVRNGAHSSWFLYPYLSFMSGYLKAPSYVKKPPEPVPEPLQLRYSMDEDMDRDDSDELLVVKEEPAAAAALPSPPKPTTFANLKHSRRLTRLKRLADRPAVKEQSTSSSSQDSKLLEMLRLLKKSDISKKKDECDSFGEYIATSLRKHDDRTQSMIKQAINNILFEQEMKKYSNYTLVISPDENPLATMAGDELDTDLSHDHGDQLTD